MAIKRNTLKKNGKSLKQNGKRVAGAKTSKKQRSTRKNKKIIRVQRKTRQDKPRRTQKKNNKKSRSKKRLNMKGGGPIPFSELGDVYENTKSMFSNATSHLRDIPTSVPSNPAVDATPNVSQQYLHGSSNTAGDVAASPDIKSIYEGSFSS